MISANSAASMIDCSRGPPPLPRTELMYAKARSDGSRTSSVPTTTTPHICGPRARNGSPNPRRSYHRQVYGCFFKDSAGMQMLDTIGVENVLSRPTTRTATAPSSSRWLTPCSAISTPTSSTNWPATAYSLFDLPFE